jgi:tRNA G46 methylase TrmB
MKEFQRNVPAFGFRGPCLFPDPWWKRKHKSGGCSATNSDLWFIVQPGGLVHSWTDVEEYFGVISRS